MNNNMEGNQCGCSGCGDGCPGCGDRHLETVKLTLEDMSQIECEIMGTFDVADNVYIALLPIGKTDVLIYRYEEIDGEIKLGLIEEDREFEQVSAAFYSFYEDPDNEIWENNCNKEEEEC